MFVIAQVLCTCSLLVGVYSSLKEMWKAHLGFVSHNHIWATGQSEREQF